MNRHQQSQLLEDVLLVTLYDGDENFRTQGVVAARQPRDVVRLLLRVPGQLQLASCNQGIITPKIPGIGFMQLRNVTGLAYNFSHRCNMVRTPAAQSILKFVLQLFMLVGRKTQGFPQKHLWECWEVVEFDHHLGNNSWIKSLPVGKNIG